MSTRNVPLSHTPTLGSSKRSLNSAAGRVSRRRNPPLARALADYAASSVLRVEVERRSCRHSGADLGPSFFQFSSAANPSFVGARGASKVSAVGIWQCTLNVVPQALLTNEFVS